MLTSAFNHDDVITEVGLDQRGQYWLIDRRGLQCKCSILEGALQTCDKLRMERIDGIRH